MSNCGKLTAGIDLNCLVPLVGGNDDRLVLINKSDIVSIGRNTVNPQIVESITLVASPAAKAYAFQGKNNSIDSKTDLVKTRYADNYNHEVVFRVFEDGPDVKLQIEALPKGRFIAILQKNYRGTADKAAFEVRGLDIGLECTVLTKDDSDADTQGAYVITLSSPDTFKEPHLPANLYITSYAASKAVVDGLL